MSIDDKVNDVKVKSSGLFSRLAGAAKYAAMAAVAAAGIGYSAQKAEAAPPIMSVTDSTSIGNYDLDFFHLGDELLVQYTVTNNSANEGANNMIQFTLPAGSNQGVYDAVAPNGWLIDINLEDTLFNGNGNYIAPTAQGVFELYSTNLGIHQDLASALATGIGSNISFTPVTVDVPGTIPEPATLFLLGMSGLMMFRRTHIN